MSSMSTYTAGAHKRVCQGEQVSGSKSPPNASLMTAAVCDRRTPAENELGLRSCVVVGCRRLSYLSLGRLAQSALTTQYFSVTSDIFVS